MQFCGVRFPMQPRADVARDAKECRLTIPVPPGHARLHANQGAVFCLERNRKSIAPSGQHGVNDRRGFRALLRRMHRQDALAGQFFRRIAETVTHGRIDLQNVTRAVHDEHKVIHCVEQCMQILPALVHFGVGAQALQRTADVPGQRLKRVARVGGNGVVRVRSEIEHRQQLPLVHDREYGQGVQAFHLRRAGADPWCVPQPNRPFVLVPF